MPQARNRRDFLLSGGALAVAASTRLTPAETSSPAASAARTRDRWLDWMQRVADPVLLALGRRELRKTMPVESAKGHEAERAIGSHLEALGRLVMGLAPWLELEPSPGESARETALRTRYRGMVREAIASAIDPASPDYMRFGQSSQTVVDASFLALGILRAPMQLLATMSPQSRERMIAAMVAERKILTGLNNWVLFSAMDEALLCKLGADWDRMRVAYALNELQSWYVGDGTYGDGPRYHADFYNSYVMHPYLLMLMEALGDQEPAWKAMRPVIENRASRLCRYPGAIHRAGWNFFCPWPLPLLSRGCVSPACRRSASRLSAGATQARPGTLRDDCRAGTHAQCAKHIRRTRLAAHRACRSSALAGRDLHLNRQPVPVQRRNGCRWACHPHTPSGRHPTQTGHKRPSGAARTQRRTMR